MLEMPESKAPTRNYQGAKLQKRSQGRKNGSNQGRKNGSNREPRFHAFRSLCVISESKL